MLAKSSQRQPSNQAPQIKILSAQDFRVNTPELKTNRTADQITPNTEPNDSSADNSLNFIRPKRSSQQSATPKQRKYSNEFEEESSSRADSVGPSNGSTVYDEAVSRYECIAILTEQENTNLKQQNRYLLEQLRKMQEREARVKKLYEKAKKYKVLWQEARLEIQQLKDEIEVYKEQAEEMKKIALHDVHRLRQRVMQTAAETEIQQTAQQQATQPIQPEPQVQKKQCAMGSESSLSKYLKSMSGEM